MMQFWSRDPGLYRAPVLKSLLVFSSTASVLHNISLLRSLHPAARYVVRIWALPSMGMWLISALVLYHCRIIERRRGSSQFASHLVLSSIISTVLFAGLFWLSDYLYSQTGVAMGVASGHLIYSLVGTLMMDHVMSVNPAHSRLGGLPFSSNLPVYTLAILLSSSSVGSIASTLTGLLGGAVVQGCGLSLPRLPSWLLSPLTRVFGSDKAPHLYTGASLNVQAQQRTDEIEQVMTNMYNNTRQRPHLNIGHPMLQPLPDPPQEQVEQLVSMGFSPQSSAQALRQTAGNVEAALTLLTAQYHSN